MLTIISTGFVASALALTALLWLAPKVGWLDRPDPRKPHQTPIPPVGGVSWFCGFVVLGLSTGTLHQLPLLYAGLTIMLLTGLVDDLRPFSSWLRLALQLSIAAVLAVSGLALLLSLGALLPGVVAVQLGVLAIPMTVFSLVGVINAVNMADGMDGLAGGYLLVSLCALVGLHALTGTTTIDATLALAGAACLLPFLLLNLRLPWQRRAKVFLGDAGSMAIGLLLGTLLIRGSQGEQAAFAPPVALWLLAVPLIDTVSVMLRRIAAGRSPFAPDQQHVHHVLLRTGFSVPRVWWILLLSAAVLALCGVAGQALRLPQSLQFGLFMLIACSYHLWVCRSLRQGRALGRVLQPQLSQL